MRIPVFYWEELSKQGDDGAAMLSSFSRLVLLFKEEENADIRRSLPEPTELAVFEGCHDEATINDRVNDWIESQGNPFSDTDSLVIVMPDNAVDNRLIGPFAGRKRAPLLFSIPQSLGSLLHVAQYLESRERRIDHLYFLGTNARFGATDRKILQTAASLAPNSSADDNRA